MPVTTDRSAPYAPPSAIIEVVDRFRNRGLPTPVTAEVLTRIGITESLQPRTLQALLVLDLIDDDGKPTSVLEGIRIAPESDFKTKILEWLNGAYAEIINVANPAEDDDIKIRDAFRTFNPVGQQDRMVTLFLQLYRWAGARTSPQTVQRAERVGGKPNKPSIRPATKSRPESGAFAASQKFASNSQIHPALAGLLASIPANNSGWSKSKRDAFLRSFEAVLDFAIPISVSEERDIENDV